MTKLFLSGTFDEVEKAHNKAWEDFDLTAYVNKINTHYISSVSNLATNKRKFDTRQFNSGGE